MAWPVRRNRADPKLAPAVHAALDLPVDTLPITLEPVLPDGIVLNAEFAAAPPACVGARRGP